MPGPVLYSRSCAEAYSCLRRQVDQFLYDPGGTKGRMSKQSMREETEQWLNRVCLGLSTQHATAAEAHNRLMLTKAFDLSAKLKRAVPLPIAAEQQPAQKRAAG